MAGSDVKAKYIAADTTAADADGVCTSQTPAAGGVQNLTIDGAEAISGTAFFVAARRITVTAVGDETARTFTITGTDVNGNALTESIAGPNATTANTDAYFRTVTQVTVDDDTADAVTVGMTGAAIDVVFAGRARLRGVFLVHSGTAGLLSFRNGMDPATAPSNFLIATVAAVNTDRDIIIPDEGIMFDEGIYIAYIATSSAVFSSFTAMYN
jgi:hypothetical protein